MHDYKIARSISVKSAPVQNKISVVQLENIQTRIYLGIFSTYTELYLGGITARTHQF